VGEQEPSHRRRKVEKTSNRAFIIEDQEQRDTRKTFWKGVIVATLPFLTVVSEAAISSCMRSFYWLLPLLLAIAAGTWLYHANQEAAQLTSKLAEMRKKIGLLEEHPRVREEGAVGGLAVASSANERKNSFAMSAQPGAIQWGGIAAMLRELEEGGDASRIEQALVSLHAKLDSMNAGEMHAALDEIGSLGLPPDRQSELEAMVVESLMSKDPEGVIQRFDSRIGNDDDAVGWVLSEALGHFADKDAAAAARWMDEKIKSGRFESKSLDGYSEARTEYESVLMSRLLDKHGTLAMDRIRALPEEDRLVVLEQMDLTKLTPQAQSSYADIIRSFVPDHDRKGAFGYVASELVYDGGWAAVDAFLDRTKATPDERVDAAQEAAAGRLQAIVEEGKPSTENIDEMRSWLSRQAPDHMEMMTGKAIGEAYDAEGYLNFEEAKQMVLSYHGRSGSDDILVGFLQSFAGQENREQSLQMLNLIQNEELRARLSHELAP
jgi:hypothetical protein